MTVQEAIEWLKAINAVQKESVHKSSLLQRKEALHMAIEALEKQIPKKVIYRDNCGNETPYQSRCPKCYEAINDTWYWAGESWCPYCGQKLDWGD